MTIAPAVCVVLAAAGAAVAAQSPVVNARVDRRTVSQPLAREIQAVVDSGTSTWIGYRVPMAARADARVTASDTCCGRCRLEPPTDLVVLVRAAANAIVELRPIAVDCDVDASGMPLVWLEGVKPDESVAWLSSFVDRASAPRKTSEAALMAIARHATPAAAPALVRAARESAAAGTRSRALFWLAERAAAEALPAIDAALSQDADADVKRQAVFALSRFPNGEGIPRLIDVARTHASVDVRRQAMFWLGQSKDARAVDFFAQILLK